MSVKCSFITKRTGTTFVTEQLDFFFPDSSIEQFTQLPNREGMRQADEETDDCRLDIYHRWILNRNKPVVVIEGVEKETDDRVKLACVLISIDEKNQDQEFYNGRQADTVDPIENRITRKGHVKVLQLHEQVASMRHVEYHKDERTMKDGLFTFEIGHYMVHKIFVG